MTRPAYYNEHDKAAARWLVELIRAGAIAPGIVDTRSIEDVTPNDLRGFSQHHFFAGIGVWSHALREAGWSDSRPVWTGSCPCQPFSAAGKGAGFSDERHLWPAWFHLIDQCRPPIILGEQVANKSAGSWLDLVQTDVEALDYTFGAVAFPAASVGAPHIRDRCYWVAHDPSRGPPVVRGSGEDGIAERSQIGGRLADHQSAGREQQSPSRVHDQWQCRDDLARCGESGWLGNVQREGSQVRDGIGGMHPIAACPVGGQAAESGSNVGDRADRHPWSDVEWLASRDGKYRPAQPGIFPLADGSPARVVRLRGYGNGLVSPAAEAWIKTVMQCLN